MRFFLKRWEPSRKLTRACQSEIAYLPLIRFTIIILVVALSFPVFYFVSSDNVLIATVRGVGRAIAPSLPFPAHTRLSVLL